MRKKNKRKAPEFKKPFIVLTRKKIAGWSLLIFFLCAWMFVLGVLVGRGTAPLKFDLAAMQKKISAPQEALPENQNRIQPQKDAVTVKDKTKLEFYEALKEDKDDTKVSVRPKPKDAELKDSKSAEKAAAPVKSANKSKPAAVAKNQEELVEA